MRQQQVDSSDSRFREGREGRLGLPSDEFARRRTLVACLLVGLLVYGLAAVCMRPTPPQPDSDPNEFSAERGETVLARMLGDESPHPMGSESHAGVRERILEILRESGYEPEIQEAFVAGTYGVFGTVRNILARLEGTTEGPAVLLVAHYDSVGSGPGAADDGAGVVAILEAARILAAGPTPRRPIIFLIDDGEEDGLLGAQAFVDQHPWAKEVRWALNLEARGSSGPSLMFETSDGNGELISLFADSVPRPFTSSLFYAVYKQMPNDTDFSVFRKHGVLGYGMAFVGDVAHYHTPLDNLANLDRGSLQHQGESCLALVRELAYRETLPEPTPDPVFFDVLGKFIVSWPANWTLPMAILALVVQLVFVVRQARARSWSVLSLLVRAVGWLLCVAGIVLFGDLLARSLAGAGALPQSWVAHPQGVLSLFWAAGLTLGLAGFAVAGKSLDGHRRWLVTWTTWTLLATGVTIYDPAMSYPLLVPALVALVWSVVLYGRRSEPNSWCLPLATVTTFAATALLWFELAILFYDALGAVGTLTAAPVALLCGTLFPTVDRWRRSWAGLLLGGLVTVGLLIWTIQLPVFSPERPGKLNLVYQLDGDTREAQWLVALPESEIPSAVRDALGGPLEVVRPHGWPEWARANACQAPDTSLEAPSLEILKEETVGGERVVRARLRSPRRAPAVGLSFHPDVPLTQISVDGHELPLEPKRRNYWYGGWRVYRCLNAPETGIEVEFRVAGSEPIEVFIEDTSPGLPTDGARLIEARPAHYTSHQDGDSTVVFRKLTF